MPVLNDLLTLASDLAWSAAEIILALRARGCATEARPDRSPITEADRQSEAVILRGLRAATPHIEIIAEEEIASGHLPAHSRDMWLIDPLDGTREFAALRDSFTVNIGLVRDGRPILGVVAVPACAEMYGGIVGLGAWKQDGAGRHTISVRTPPVGGLAVLRSRLGAENPALLAALPDAPVASLTVVESALKFCRIAEGSADAYVRLGRTMEWDTAAGEAILSAAGGSLLVLDGGALGYGKPGWVNPPFICRGGL